MRQAYRNVDIAAAVGIRAAQSRVVEDHVYLEPNWVERIVSVIMVSPLGFAYIRRTVSHLREQTIANKIELIPVAPNAKSLKDATESDYAGFGEVNRFYTGEPIENVDEAAGLVMLKGKSDIIA